jgi:predicted permease
MTGQSRRPDIRRLFRLSVRSAERARTDADDELASFVDARIDHLVARGVPIEQARAQASASLGGSIADIRASLRRSAEGRERRLSRRERLHDLAQDVRYATRSLRRAPAFASIVIATLAVGIGATTAIFSVLHALLLRPLPYPDPQRLMRVTRTVADTPERRGSDDLMWSYAKFLVFRDAQTVFADLSPYSEAQFTVAAGEAERVAGEFITGRYLTTLGLSVARGRNFTGAHEAAPGAGREIIIADRIWRRRFGADPAVIGKPLSVNGDPFTIIGVMPPGFAGLTGEAEVFLPTGVIPGSSFDPSLHDYNLVARLEPGVSEDQARVVVSALGAVVDRAFPNPRSATAAGAMVRPLDDARVAPVVRRSVVTLFGAVAFVLLIACVNVANLMIGRAESRHREIAIRLAIGAGRGRLVRLLLVEGLLIATVAGLLGVGIASLGVRALAAMSPTAIRVGGGLGGLGVIGPQSIRLDSTALAFTAGVALAVGLLFGLMPALRATRPSLTSALKSDRSTRRARDGRVGRSALVIGEVALCMVLLAGSGLMLRSLAKLIEVDPGFEPRGVLTARMAVLGGAVGRDTLPAFYERLHDRLAALPGVSAVGFASDVPMTGVSTTGRVVLLGRAQLQPASSAPVNVVRTTPDWFDVLRIPLRHGRRFTRQDGPSAPSVVLVNEAAARAFWPNDNPVGKRVAVNRPSFDDTHSGAEVIGVVGDVRGRPNLAPAPTVYLPFAQNPNSRMPLFLRTTGDPGAVAIAARAAVREVAPSFPLYDIQTMDARIETATAQARFTSGVLGLFSVLALALATIGIYGVMTVLVGERRREIGVRMALGATGRTIVGMVVGEGFRLVAAGVVLGLAGALAVTRVLRTMLFDIAPTDPPTYVGVILVFVGAAALASWMPARRAARVDPLQILRSD